MQSLQDKQIGLKLNDVKKYFEKLSTFYMIVIEEFKKQVTYAYTKI